MAGNFETEGTFYNHTEEVRYCYYNHDERPCIVQHIVYPNSTCIGDAFGTASAVFKIPDRTTFYCDNGCRPAGAKSYALFHLAGMKKGFEHYGSMSFQSFQTLMGGLHICRPEQEHLPQEERYRGEPTSSDQENAAP